MGRKEEEASANNDRKIDKNKEVDEEAKRRKRGRNKGKDEGREETVSVNSICPPPPKKTHIGLRTSM